MLSLSAKKGFWAKLDKILGYAAVASVFALIFIVAHRAIFDLDIWLHLKAGEMILQNNAVPTSDIFSFTLQGKPWVDHEWLFQVLTQFVYQKWQIEGLIALQCYVIILAFFILFLMGKEAMKANMEVSIFVFVVAYTSIARFNIRPDIFSMLFFALWLYLLRFSCEKKIIWLLVPLQVLWVNLHGYFFLGPLVTFLFILAEFIRRKVRPLPWQWEKAFVIREPDYQRLQKVFIVLLLACLVNPRGWLGAVYPLEIFKGIISGKTQVFFQHIQELQPTFLFGGSLIGNLYHLLAGLCFLLMAINLRRLRIIEILLAGFFFLFALRVRNIAFFAFVGYLIIVSYMGPTLARIFAKVKIEPPFRQRIFYLFRYGLAVFFIAWLVLRIDKVSMYGYYDFTRYEFISFLSGIEEKRYPKPAADFVLANEIAPNMFNDFNSGAYLIGRAFPRKVFIDGRTELYGPEFFTKYQAALEGDLAVFQELCQEYKITAFFCSLTSDKIPGILQKIYHDPQWRLVFFDDTGIIFLKDVPENQQAIEKNRIDLDKYFVEEVDLKKLGLRRVYPSPYIKRARLMYVLQYDAAVTAECKAALRVMPDCGEAYHLLGKLDLRKKLYAQALENLRCAALFLPGNSEVFLDLGICLKELKEDSSSLKALEGAVRRNPRFAKAFYHLGCAYLDLHNTQQAISALKQAVKFARKDARCHFKLGEAFYEKGKNFQGHSLILKAREEWKLAIGLDLRDRPDLSRDIIARLKETEKYQK